MNGPDDHDIVVLDTPLPDEPFRSRVPIIQLAALVPKKTTKFSARFLVKEERAYPEKGIHTSPNVLSKFAECDGIPIGPFVTDLNLALEILIAWPLKGRRRFSKMGNLLKQMTPTPMRICVVGPRPSGAKI